jgi:hypothetical protein
MKKGLAPIGFTLLILALFTVIANELHIAGNGYLCVSIFLLAIVVPCLVIFGIVLLIMAAGEKE